MCSAGKKYYWKQRMKKNEELLINKKRMRRDCRKSNKNEYIKKMERGKMNTKRVTKRRRNM